MMQLNFRDVRPIYSQIIDNFRTQIRAGVLLPGERLPSVRELAGELAINPNTIQRAYRELEMEGWIASVPGKGSFVCGIPGSEKGEKDALLKTLEETVQALLQKGMTVEEITRRIGGNIDA